MAKTVWVMAEWQGPAYAVPVQGGRGLYDRKGVWDYGMHIRGDRFAVLREDAEGDKRFVILGGIKAEDEETSEIERRLAVLEAGNTSEKVIFRRETDEQPPAGEELLEEANEGLEDLQDRVENTPSQEGPPVIAPSEEVVDLSDDDLKPPSIKKSKK